MSPRRASQPRSTAAGWARARSAHTRFGAGCTHPPQAFSTPLRSTQRDSHTHPAVTSCLGAAQSPPRPSAAPLEGAGAQSPRPFCALLLTLAGKSHGFLRQANRMPTPAQWRCPRGKVERGGSSWRGSGVSPRPPPRAQTLPGPAGGGHAPSNHCLTGRGWQEPGSAAVHRSRLFLGKTKKPRRSSSAGSAVEAKRSG